jgi:hypothetical protein
MMEFVNGWALYLSAVLIPIIILYLLKPKPKNMKIPSLMFIREIEQRRRFRSFFRRIMRDPLLLLQLLIFAIIIVAIMNPFYLTEEVRNVDQDVVLVLDISASMSAGNRFAEAKEIASSIISDLDDGDQVSLVLAENIPIVVLRKGNKDDARSVLNNVNVKSTTTGLGGAILLASDLLKESKVEKIVYVISDFSGSEGMNPEAAQKTAAADGIGVQFVRVGTGSDNVGIIASRSGRNANECFMEIIVRNYGQGEGSVDAVLELNGQSSDLGSKTISPGDSEVFYLSSNCFSMEYEAFARINNQDIMGVDDEAYAMIPSEMDLDVLLIRERESDEFIKFALESLRSVSLSESYPPIYPQDFGVYDTIIFQDAKPQNILEGIFPSLQAFVENGGNVIVLGFDNLEEVDKTKLDALLPVEVIDMLNMGGRPNVLFDHQIIKDIDLEEVSVRRIMQTDAKIGTITLAELGINPLLSHWELGSGKVVYLGLTGNSTENDFHLKPSFPIFWYQLIDWMNSEESIRKSENFRTGEQLPSLGEDAVQVRKPSGEVIEGLDIMLDEAGFYEVIGTGTRISASLLDEVESDISSFEEYSSVLITEGYDRETNREEVMNELFWMLAFMALVLILLEWFYYKRRGSL